MSCFFARGGVEAPGCPTRGGAEVPSATDVECGIDLLRSVGQPRVPAECLSGKGAQVQEDKARAKG